MTDLPILPSGLIAVTGGEGSGKTHFLRRLSEAPGSGAQWLDLGLPSQDGHTPQEIWAAMQMRSPLWNAGLHQELVEALLLGPHQGKKLYMLSTGSRRKVALAGLLACGAPVTCLDQPYAALDGASIRVVNGFLKDRADHTTRSWVVADYEAHPQLPWRQVISLDGL
ncbi:MAG: hypothetical protein H7172_07180 [Ferruginibacter sp.]|nr:hypothetical protein [Rhodoferax sp.]